MKSGAKCHSILFRIVFFRYNSCLSFLFTSKCQRSFFTVVLLSFFTIPVYADGGALQFDGIDDYAEAPAVNAFNTIGTGNFTMEARVRIGNDNTQLYPIILSNRTDGSTGVVLFIHTGTLSFESGKLWLNIQGTNYPCTNGPDMRDNLCHHIAVVNNGINIRFYVDGTMVTERPVLNGGNDISSSGAFRIGHDAAYPSGEMNFKGEIGEVRLWNVARTDQEISDFSTAPVTSNPSSLLAYWKLNEQSGQTSVNNKNTGDMKLGASLSSESTDPVWTSSCVGINEDLPVSGNVYEFDGVDDYIEIPILTDFNSIATGPFTLEARINMSSQNLELYPVVFSNRTDHTTGIVLFVHTGTEPWASGKLWINIQGYNYPCSGCPDLRDDLCHHIAVVNNTTNLQFFVDGTMVTERPVVSGANDISSNGVFQIGHDPAYPAGSNHFKGEISEVRLWNIARTNSEISFCKDLSISNQPPLIGYWKLNEENGQVAYGNSSNKHGRLGNSTLADNADPGFKNSCLTVSTPQLFSLPFLPTLNCHSTKLNLAAKSNAAVPQIYRVLSGPANIEDDTLLTVTGPGKIKLNVHVSAAASHPAKDSTWILESVNDRSCQINIYNFVSADNDGVNDSFEVTAPLEYQYSVKIFNRWGDLIFEKENYDNSWSGTNQPSGSYRYQLSITKPIQQELSGNIHLIK